ncbi:hypothetical protein BDV93DRAFT_514973 [Ceratobasidium sp. AG-I]|nr:hypothetical protein BDV93DRAFT_514973 [Ceratobasidium sp. AG-I]
MSFWLYFILFAPLIIAQIQQEQNIYTIDDSYVYSSSNPGGIQYTSAWIGQPNATGSYNSTYHACAAQQCELVFFFQGDQIAYYGTSTPDPTPVTVTLDVDTKIKLNHSSDDVQPQTLLWQSDPLGPGDHIIQISNGGINSTILSFDFFRIRSDHGIVPTFYGPGCSSVSKGAVVVDEVDPAVSYSGGWEVATGSLSYFGGSMRHTNQAGNILRFQFNGTRAWYFADVDVTTHADMEISIDGMRDKVVSGTRLHRFKQVLLWSSPELPSGLHTVEIKHIGRQGQWVRQHAFRSLTAIICSSGNKPKKRFPVAAVVGASIAGLVVLVAFGGTFICYRRKRAKNDKNDSTIQSAQADGANTVNKTISKPDSGHGPRGHNMVMPDVPLVRRPEATEFNSIQETQNAGRHSCPHNGVVYRAIEQNSQRAIALKKSRVPLEVKKSLLQHEAPVLTALHGHLAILEVFGYGAW